MGKDPELLKLPAEAWRQLPPRFSTANQLFSLMGGAPQKLSGFCQGCDTNINHDWCVPTTSPKLVMETRHLADPDIGILRPSELRIIEDWQLANSGT